MKLLQDENIELIDIMNYYFTHQDPTKFNKDMYRDLFMNIIRYYCHDQNQLKNYEDSEIKEICQTALTDTPRPGMKLVVGKGLYLNPV